MLNSLFNLILDKNLGRATPQKLAVVVGEPLVNPTLKSHTSNAGLKSHTLQLHPNVPPCFPVPVPMQTGYALACFDQSQVNTAMPTSSPTLLVCS
ncbi:hypothetical protein GLYMA_16G002100v4 [Glycine max]|uniref:Uncharacterized protein n=1 Tax=Glycine max TaxID=3847 RepID=A0A0R0FVF6_SOYBN|nr:hypothetical protein GYH30_043693 [Glycine max]KRH06052.1 hypothetical protein GLYMA_16G002100v4 [Glycine max]